jgi:Arc/MetJ-type ribon-helix-helix transcriptional regulator
MKIKVNISMEKELHELVKYRVANSVFRNTSHLIEHAVTQFMEKEK